MNLLFVFECPLSNTCCIMPLYTIVQCVVLSNLSLINMCITRNNLFLGLGLDGLCLSEIEFSIAGDTHSVFTDSKTNNTCFVK